MRITTRVHEWLAEHVPWVQYPDARFQQQREPGFLDRLRGLTWKQKSWLLFALFWGSLIALSIYGNSL